ncbi:MAG: hypothetical protein R6V44_10435, partial [Paracoccaceae bacterium]
MTVISADCGHVFGLLARCVSRPLALTKSAGRVPIMLTSNDAQATASGCPGYGPSYQIIITVHALA